MELIFILIKVLNKPIIPRCPGTHTVASAQQGYKLLNASESLLLIHIFSVILNATNTEALIIGSKICSKQLRDYFLGFSYMPGVKQFVYYKIPGYPEEIGLEV